MESRNQAAAGPDVVLDACNAHVVRKFEAAMATQPRAGQGLRFLRALYAIESEADAAGLRGADRLAYRQRRSRRVLRRFRQWLEGLLARSLPLAKIAKYRLKHWDALTRFVDHPTVLPLDNNAAEREFQRHATLRQACLFAGSPEGAHRWAVLLGVVRTAQTCGVDVQAYLTWLFERRGTHRKHYALPARDLTPMAYRDQQNAERRAA